MTFYQELQLDQKGSKAYISEFKEPKQKLKHILIYLLKITLNIAFSMAVIILFTVLLGAENSIVGLVVLMSVMVCRASDFGIHASHSVGGIYIIFAIYAVAPKLTNMLPAGAAFCVDAISIMLILLIGCHNVKMFNHATLVLSYLFLQAYDISGDAFIKRIIGLSVGAVLATAVFYRKHRKLTYECGFKDLFKDFSLSSERSRWQIRFTLCISSIILIATLLNITKPVWIAIAAMSVLAPFNKNLVERAKLRAPGNILGSLICFAVFAMPLPDFLYGYMGIVAGFGTGLSSTYFWQTVCNAFASLCNSVSVLGFPTAMILRALHNIVGSSYAFFFDLLSEKLLLRINNVWQRRVRNRNALRRTAQ